MGWPGQLQIVCNMCLCGEERVAPKEEQPSSKRNSLQWEGWMGSCTIERDESGG